MIEPSKLLLKFSRRLWPEPTEQAKFIQALIQPQPLNPSILWCQVKPEPIPWIPESPLPWQPDFVDRLPLSSEPGRHSLHQQGYFYCLDFSSVFAASTLLQISSPIDFVLDVCASPGGKSLFAQVALRPQLMLSNEVIGKRRGALITNLRRCQPHSRLAPPDAQRIVLSRDARILAQVMPQSADVVIVDAPCSGQSLLAKGVKAPGCFHPVSINKNANRQKRILANSAQIVAPQGYLAYMTCAYSVEENEQVSAWLLKKFSHLQPVMVPHLEAYQSHLTSIPCYRMWPQDRLGAGAFTVLFRNTKTGQKHQVPSDLIEQMGFQISTSPNEFVSV
ncbi:MAG: RsmB/NOP family class I SAM-dependent RNA methyltransferase [Cyanothece sp. SIO1E1]|nr:RsmB/NOP family class I SAM-dependent RNA methyltransferase [Cyanothece sp. SIO1E1]